MDSCGSEEVLFAEKENHTNLLRPFGSFGFPLQKNNLRMKRKAKYNKLVGKSGEVRIGKIK